MDVPVRFIRNDTESQPRHIEHDHVWTLAVDFAVHPVHEPSNCRVVQVGDSLADLLQFDGQHKTTAQVVLGRAEVPMKFYYEPNEAMIQELVVQIQQGIKKRPLSTTDTLRKLDDVVQDKVDAYRKVHGRAPTEPELVDAQPKQDQRSFKARLLTNLEFAILDDETFELVKYVSKKATRSQPFTDTVLVRRLIRPFVCQDLVDEPLDNAVQRDRERETVIHVLNNVARNMLEDKWKPTTANENEDLQTRRARNFFYQAAIGWWLGEVLVPAIWLLIPKSRWKKLFLEGLTSDQEEHIDSFVDVICGWPIWSTTDPDQLAALRSNTVTNVTKAFDGYDQARLIRDAQEL